MEDMTEDLTFTFVFAFFSSMHLHGLRGRDLQGWLRERCGTNVSSPLIRQKYNIMYKNPGRLWDQDKKYGLTERRSRLPRDRDKGCGGLINDPCCHLIMKINPGRLSMDLGCHAQILDRRLEMAEMDSSCYGIMTVGVGGVRWDPM